MDNSPSVAILILNYNGRFLLEEAITSYQSNDYANFKIILIDNGSSDDSSKLVAEKFPEITIISLRNNQGYAGGFNYGLSYAFDQLGVSFVIVSNNDVKADSKLVSSLVACAQRHSDAGFVVGKVYYYDEPHVLQTVGKKYDPIIWNGGHIGNREEDIGQYDVEEERFFADDIYTLVTRELYKSVGGYNVDFFLQSEEYEWQARAKSYGFRIFYTPHAKLWHKDSYTIGKDSPLKIYYNYRNPMLVILMHKDAYFFKKYIRYFFIRNVLKTSMVYLIKQQDIRRFISVWQGFFSGLIYGYQQKLFGIRHWI